MNANQLFYFATVGKYSNITKAAAELHISQPAITKSIQQLEEELGIEMDVFEAGSQYCIEQVSSGELDLAIVLLEEKDETDLDRAILLESSFDFCTNRNSPFRDRTEVHPSELENEKLILFYPGIMIHQLLKTYHLTPKFVLRSSQVSTIRKYLQCGLASTFQFPEVFQGDPQIISIPLQKKIPLYLAVLKRHGSLSCQGAQRAYSFFRKQTIAAFL